MTAAGFTEAVFRRAGIGEAPAADAAQPLRDCAGRQLVSILPVGFSQPMPMKSCPIFPVIGTITVVGPSNPDRGGVLYRYFEFCEKGSRMRRLTIVRAIEALAALIEQHAIGMFLFWERQGERCLWGVSRADGLQQVNFEAMRACFQQSGSVHAS